MSSNFHIKSHSKFLPASIIASYALSIDTLVSGSIMPATAEWIPKNVSSNFFTTLIFPVAAGTFHSSE